MPAPYPRADPARSVASRVGRGAPRGAPQARGLAAVAGADRFGAEQMPDSAVVEVTHGEPEDRPVGWLIYDLDDSV